MNNCRAGLYSFVPISCWLREKGVASPPSLVVLGLTLPDSRMLCGIASIGLTLINIAIILPHLRQPLLDSVHAAREQGIQGQVESSLGRLDPTKSVALAVECLVLAPWDDAERQSPPLSCSTTVTSVCSAVVGPLGSDVDTHAGSHTVLLPATKHDDGLTPCFPDVGFSLKQSSSGHSLAREGRDAIYIPLPVPDDLEIAFFDAPGASVSGDSQGETCPVVTCERGAAPTEDATTDDHDPLFGKSIDISQHVVADRSGETGLVEIDKNFRDMIVPVTENSILPNETKAIALEQNDPSTEGAIDHRQNDIVACGITEHTSKVGHSKVRRKETLAKRLPESLQFIPQSVISRYPSAPTVSTDHYFSHQATTSGYNPQGAPLTPDILLSNPGILLGGTVPQASYTTLEGRWRASSLPGSQRRTLIIQAILAQDHPIRGPASLSERCAEHDFTSPRKHPTRPRRLGVLARAALRNRRAAARRGKNNTSDDSSASDSDSDTDTDSQDSSGSSADENMLPHILGTDLIAAIESNSESGLNLAGSRETLAKHVPLDVYGDFLVPDDSAADVSMMMHVSSIDDPTDGEVRVPSAFHPRTYEEIQQWASGVVQKCVRQVCRTHEEPRSPTQASDCAERPSNSGISKCPLSGLHCKLGHATSGEVPAERIKELQASLTPVSLTNRQSLSVRNVRDIPEFVPSERQVSAVPGRVDVSRKRTRSTIDVTRDAATEVIARVESQATFGTRQWVVSMDEKRIMSAVGGLQRTLRCA